MDNGCLLPLHHPVLTSACGAVELASEQTVVPEERHQSVLLESHHTVEIMQIHNLTLLDHAVSLICLSNSLTSIQHLPLFAGFIWELCWWNVDLAVGQGLSRMLTTRPVLAYSLERRASVHRTVKVSSTTLTGLHQPSYRPTFPYSSV